MAKPVFSPSEQCMPIHCRAVENCVDYRSYVYDLDADITPAAFLALRTRLSMLGTMDRERLGVAYIKEQWGFLVFPPRGFPELRVSFYKETDKTTELAIHDAISLALKQIHT